MTLESSVCWKNPLDSFLFRFVFACGFINFHLRTYADGHPNGTQQPENDLKTSQALTFSNVPPQGEHR